MEQTTTLHETNQAASGHIAVCSFYRFIALGSLEALAQQFRQRMEEFNIRGTILLAEEGINATISGEEKAMQAFVSEIRADTRLKDMPVKWHQCAAHPFQRAKVRIKRNIVDMAMDVSPACRTGTPVAPEAWNALLEDPDVIVIDTRNEYEYMLGTFDGAINPHTHTFKELSQFVKESLDPLHHRKVAMFCTGGIRCEKSTAYLLEQGFDEVYQLEGGILHYLDVIPKEDSKWRGDCFVFDERIAVNHQLTPVTGYYLCDGCGQPVHGRHAHHHICVNRRASL